MAELTTAKVEPPLLCEEFPHVDVATVIDVLFNFQKDEAKAREYLIEVFGMAKSTSQSIKLSTNSEALKNKKFEALGFDTPEKHNRLPVNDIFYDGSKSMPGSPQKTVSLASERQSKYKTGKKTSKLDFDGCVSIENSIEENGNEKRSFESGSPKGNEYQAKSEGFGFKVQCGITDEEMRQQTARHIKQVMVSETRSRNTGVEDEFTIRQKDPPRDDLKAKKKRTRRGKRNNKNKNKTKSRKDKEKQSKAEYKQSQIKESQSRRSQQSSKPGNYRDGNACREPDYENEDEEEEELVYDCHPQFQNHSAKSRNFGKQGWRGGDEKDEIESNNTTESLSNLDDMRSEKTGGSLFSRIFDNMEDFGEISQTDKEGILDLLKNEFKKDWDEEDERSFGKIYLEKQMIQDLVRFYNKGYAQEI